MLPGSFKRKLTFIVERGNDLGIAFEDQKKDIDDIAFRVFLLLLMTLTSFMFLICLLMIHLV